MFVQRRFAFNSDHVLPHMKSSLRTPRLTSMLSLYHLSAYPSSLSARAGPTLEDCDTSSFFNRLCTMRRGGAIERRARSAIRKNTR